MANRDYTSLALKPQPVKLIQVGATNYHIWVKNMEMVLIRMGC